MNDVKKLLIEAKSLIEDPNRWIKNRYESMNDKGEMCYCAVGAFEEATSRHLLDGDDTDGAYWILSDSRPARYRNVPAFNDDPDTTHADVMAMYDRAIEVADEK